jgi:hypothetical protein
MTLSQRQPRLRVFPVLGDLFDTVPAFLEALQHEARPSTDAKEGDVAATAAAP